MNSPSTQWAWIGDERPVQTQLNVERFDSERPGHPASDAAVVIALRLRLEGLPQEALRVLSTVKDDLDALLLGGQILFEMEQFEEAAERYAELSRRDADHPFASFNHGICLARHGNWKAAAESLQRAVVLNPDMPKAWFALGVCLLNQGLSTEAKSCFSRSTKIAPDYAPALFGLAAALQVQGKHSEALAIYERMLETQTDGKELLSNALAAAMDAGDTSMAATFATRLLRVHTQSPAALFALFSLAADRGDFRDAANWCTQLAEAKPESFDDHFNLGVCYQRLGRYNDGVGAFENALELKSDETEALEGLAQCLSELSDARAKDVWRRLLELVPEQHDYWFRLGLLHFDSGELKDAANAFETCVRLTPDSLDAWLNLATTRCSSGETDRALEAYKTALSLDSGCIAARRGLAALAIDAGDADSASGYREGLASEDWDIGYNLARLRQSQGDLAAAATLYREVLDANPDFAEALLNLGNVLFSQGDVEESKKCWASALAKRPELSIQFLSSAAAMQ